MEIAKNNSWYNQLSKPVKASLWFTISSVIQKGIQFLTVPILTRMMSESQYGEYSVFLAWHQIISIFATLNLWNYVLNNGMIKYERDRDAFLSSLQGLSTLTTLILFVLYLCFTQVWETATRLSRPTMHIMFLELFFLPSFEYWCARRRFEYRYRGVVFLSILIAVLVPLVSIPLIMVTENKGLSAIAGRTLTSAAVYLIPWFYIAYKGRKFYSQEYWRFALKFNIPLIPHFLSIIILQQSDRIMISHICGDDKAAIYSVAYSAAMILQIVNSAIVSSFVPYMYQAIKAQKYKVITQNSNVFLVLIAFLNLMLICVAPEAIRILGPEQYYEAAYVIPPVAISGIFMFMFNLFATVEYYFEETKFVAAGSITAAIANVILNAIFIPIFGFQAAGYTTLICYIFYSIGHYVFMRLTSKKYIEGIKIFDARFIITLAILSVLSSLFLIWIYNYWFIRYSLITIASVVLFCKRQILFHFLKTIKEGK